MGKAKQYFDKYTRNRQALRKVDPDDWHDLLIEINRLESTFEAGSFANLARSIGEVIRRKEDLKSEYKLLQ